VSLAELGQRVGRVMKRKKFSPGAVSEWESGGRTPDLATIEALATTLGVRVEWLAFGRGDMSERPGVVTAADEMGELDVGDLVDDNPRRHRKAR
jgi:transcriptional regulator with XRE-family HTH domain